MSTDFKNNIKSTRTTSADGFLFEGGNSGLRQSGRVEDKTTFFTIVRETQGKSWKVRGTVRKSWTELKWSGTILQKWDYLLNSGVAFQKLVYLYN